MLFIGLHKTRERIISKLYMVTVAKFHVHRNGANVLIEKKIRGVEQELAMNTRPPLPHGSLVHLIGMAIEELKKEGLVTNIRVEEPRLDYLALNGFRVYNDMSHLELSTPSYNSPLEAVVYDKVAELLAYYAVRNLKQHFKEINVYKNNVSNIRKGPAEWSAVSYSTHSSIIMDRTTCNLEIWNRVEEALIPFMVARIPLIGSGDLVPVRKDGGIRHRGKELTGDNLRFAISPRAFFIRKLSSNDTVEARGLLNQRDDPHADPNRYWRLHDINWEGLRSPFQIYLRDSLETLVMMAYEEGFLRNPPALEDPITAIKEISGDTEACEWKVTVQDGRKVDPLAEILEGFYLAGVEEMISQGDPSPDDRLAFNLLDATVQVLNERRLEYLLDGIDWITKKMLIEEYAPNDLNDALGICNQYALIDGTVLGYLGEELNVDERETTFSLERSFEFARDAIPAVDWGSMSILIGNALRRGPEDTREYIRCLAAREFPFLLNSVEWERINFHSASINLEEPFKFNKAMCGEVLEASTENLASFLQAVMQIEVSGESVVHVPSEDHEMLDEDRKEV